MEEIKVNRTIEEKIYLIRGQRVMSDRDLAVLYGVATKNLKQQVNRNLDRSPGISCFDYQNKNLQT